MLTLGQAAKEAGVAKSSLSRAIKIGRISAKKQENGSYLIDPAELFRVYQPKPNLDDGQRQNKSIELVLENKVLQKEIQLLREQLDHEREHCVEWRSQATRLLEDKRVKQGIIERVFAGLQGLRKQKNSG